MTSQRSGCPDHPAHRPTVARLTGVKRRGRTKYRSQLLCFQWIYERTGGSACTVPTPNPRRSQVSPRGSRLGHGAAQAPPIRPSSSSGVRSRDRRPSLSSPRRRRDSPRRRRRWPSRPPGRPRRRAGRRPRKVPRPGARPRRRAASSSGAGCGLACAAVSPQMSTAARCAKPSAWTSGAAKRVALLVTMPHGSACPHEPGEHRLHRREDRGLARHASLRSGRGTRRAAQIASVGRGEAERHADHPARARSDHPPDARRTAKAQGRARYASLLQAPARSGALSIKVPSRSDSTAWHGRLPRLMRACGTRRGS